MAEEMKRVFGLAEDKISHETVAALRTLLAKAERGDIIGIAFTIMNKQRTYNVNTAGELHRNMTFAIGTLMVLVGRLLYQIIKKMT